MDDLKPLITQLIISEYTITLNKWFARWQVIGTHMCVYVTAQKTISGPKMIRNLILKCYYLLKYVRISQSVRLADGGNKHSRRYKGLHGTHKAGED